MRRSNRVLLVGVAIELALVALTWYLIGQLKTGGLRPSVPLDEAVATVGQVMGTVIGVLAAILIVTFAVLRRKERS